MKTIMFASGPKLKKNYLNGQLMMTDHYNFICSLLGMRPLKNDGNLTKVISMFEDGTHSTNNLANSTVGKSRSKLTKLARSVRRDATSRKSSSDMARFNYSVYLVMILSLLISQFRIFVKF